MLTHQDLLDQIESYKTDLYLWRILNMKKIIKKTQDHLDAQEYVQLLEHIKTDILQTQLKAISSVTTELTMLYWRIGQHVSNKSQQSHWGDQFIKKLAQDLKSLFPGIAGFSLRNLHYMRRMGETYVDLNCATAVAQLPWGHNIALLERLSDNNQRFWYAQKTVENGWSRSMLCMCIQSDLYGKQGKAITNFQAVLPALDSDLAQQALKDPYNFDFLMIDGKAREREIEQGLIHHIQKFLVELGTGFSFAGRQYPIKIGNEDCFIDMLFYNFQLNCFFVIELKATQFDAQNVGQINMYLTAVDKLIKRPTDNPTIGLILCTEKDNVKAEYALQDVNKPIGISCYTTQILESLPQAFKGKLPTIEEIEAEFAKSKTKTIKTFSKKTT